jgi:hypothetical protein
MQHGPARPPRPPSPRASLAHALQPPSPVTFPPLPPLPPRPTQEVDPDSQMSDKQQQWVTIQRLLGATRLQAKFRPPKQAWRMPFYRLHDSAVLEWLVTFVILVGAAGGGMMAKGGETGRGRRRAGGPPAPAACARPCMHARRAAHRNPRPPKPQARACSLCMGWTGFREPTDPCTIGEPNHKHPACPLRMHRACHDRQLYVCQVPFPTHLFPAHAAPQANLFTLFLVRANMSEG